MKSFNIDTKGSAAVVYCRVSTEEQGDKGQSLEVQEAYCRKFCEDAGWEVINVFKDSFTGRSWSRPGFMTMREAIEESYEGGRPVKYVVVYDTSRFTRNGDLDKGKKKISPATLVIASTNMIVDGEDAATDIVTSISTTIDRHQVKVTREKTKASLNKKIEDGFHVSKPLSFALYEDIGGFPIGLVKTEKYVVLDAKKRIQRERSPTEIRYLHELWEKADDGYSVEQLAKLWHISYGALHRYLRGGEPHYLKEKGSDGKYHPVVVADDNGGQKPLLVQPRYSIPPRLDTYLERCRVARASGKVPPAIPSLPLTT